MAERPVQPEKSVLKPNPHCPPDREINILLLGQTGVGKSTFINVFANCLVYNTLEQAIDGEIQVIIPFSFSFTDPNTFDERMIVMGNEDKYEQFNGVDQPYTQQCRSYVFPIGDRNLRLIDTPGIGDTRGLEQDTKHFREILAYIAQYEHLNAVFIMLKPNEERLNILFRFYINELLRHLYVDVKDNLVFVFTNAGSTFFKPGRAAKILKVLFEEHRQKHQVEVPFSRENTYLVDNESFRYLAIRKNGIEFDNEHTQDYIKIWDHSVKEYSRLMEHITKCGLHAVSDTLSLNNAEQLVRKLPRPIAETARLVEENIRLAKEHKKKVLENPQIAPEGIPQNTAVFIPLRHPQIVCTGEKCCRVIEVGTEKKLEYLSICHDECYLKGVIQETLDDPRIGECTVMNSEEGLCKVCGCHWRKHKHITYEYKTNRIYVISDAKISAESNQEMSLRDIDKSISDLREEERQIQDIYRKLAEFLHANAILPINDGYIDYLQYFIREEQMKQNAGAHSTEVITGLQNIATKFEQEMALLKRTLTDQRDSGDEMNIPQPDEIFTLVDTLYELPISGKQIREQVEGIKIGEAKYSATRENYIELPEKAAKSHLMRQLKSILSAK